MAKELDKLSKEFAPLKKTAATLVENLGSVGTNIGHFRSMNGEVKDEVTRRVGELRKAGRTGTKLSDFDDDKELKVVLAESANNKKKMAELVKKSNEILAEGKTTLAALNKLVQKLDDEIAERKKKKDRKVFAVDSASLPDLEKLRKEVAEVAKSLDDDVVTMLTTTPYTYDPADTDKLLEKAVNASAGVRAELDQKMLDKRGLDLRLLGKNLTLAKKHRKDVSERLVEVIKLAKAGNKGKASDELAAATEARKNLQEIAEPYERAMKGLNKYDLLAMEQSKDGQTIIASTNEIAKLDLEAGNELDKVLSKIKL